MSSRIERLAQQLICSSLTFREDESILRNVTASRVASDPFGDESHSSTEVDEGWSKAPGEGKGHPDSHHFLFDDDRDDLDLDFSGGDDRGNETLRKVRLKILAGMVYASLGEADAVVKEVSPNELSVSVQDLSWKIAVGDEGRVTISGFDSGSEQFVGKLSDRDAEQDIVKISENIHQLISDDIDDRSEPPEEPVHFGPDDTPGETETADSGAPPPAAPTGDQGVAPPAPDMATPPDLGMAPPAPGMMPPAPGMMPPAPGMAPPAPGTPPYPPATPPMPAASRRASPRHSRRRDASARLEQVANQLRDLGGSLGEEGDEVFSKLADRVDRVTRMIDQSFV